MAHVPWKLITNWGREREVKKEWGNGSGRRWRVGNWEEGMEQKRIEKGSERYLSRTFFEIMFAILQFSEGGDWGRGRGETSVV